MNWHMKTMTGLHHQYNLGNQSLKLVWARKDDSPFCANLKIIHVSESGIGVESVIWSMNGNGSMISAL